jgi:conjugative relaxase-like TrwC/TraI family protein
MLSVSPKWLSAENIQEYHKHEYTAVSQRYFSESDQVWGWYHGKLAEELNLVGKVNEQSFVRLSEGKDPVSGIQLLDSRNGKHRAALDCVIHTPKSVSLAALVGGDEEVRRAHRASVRAALDFLEQHCQAKQGGNNPPLTTGKWIVATFEHDTARPIDGRADPHLHTHCLLFNMTAKDANSDAYAIQSNELYRLQTVTTRVYQNELAARLKALGYELERGKNHAPEIKGFDPAYLKEVSRRAEHIQKERERLGLTGRTAEGFIAHNQREDKLQLTPEEMQKVYKELDAKWDHQAEAVVEQAQERRAKGISQEQGPSAKRAVDFAIRKLSERHSVFERTGGRNGGIVQHALEYGQGHIKLADIEREIDRRKGVEISEQERQTGRKNPELVVRNDVRPKAPGERYTTAKAIETERKTIEMVLGRKGLYEPIVKGLNRDEFRATHQGNLNDAQKYAAWDLLHAKDQVIGLQGQAGSGKTRSLKVVAQLARQSGYYVQGLATTSGASKELGKSEIQTETIQKHLQRLDYDKRHNLLSQKRLYVLDESSMASAVDIHKFVKNLRPQDRVILVGDIKQHQSIEAGRIFHQLQIAGMTTVKLNKIVRQQEPELLKAVQMISKGDVHGSLQQLDSMGAIREIGHRQERFDAIARQYGEHPTTSLVVSPDNQSRQELDSAIRRHLQTIGIVKKQEAQMPILLSRQDLTKPDLERADKYQVGDWIKYGQNNSELGIKRGDYGKVISTDTEKNMLAVERRDGKIIEYNPEERKAAMAVYQSDYRSFAVGDRIQFTAPDKQHGVANRELGNIEKIDGTTLSVRIEPKAEEAGRLINVNLNEFRHIDHGYTMTSYSSQGQTIEHVIAQIDTSDGKIQGLLDKTALYVMQSRAKHEFTIYTDSQAQLEKTVSKMQVKQTALTHEQTAEYSAVA